jgi:hypothetical protein
MHHAKFLVFLASTKLLNGEHLFQILEYLCNFCYEKKMVVTQLVFFHYRKYSQSEIILYLLNWYSNNYDVIRICMHNHLMDWPHKVFSGKCILGNTARKIKQSPHSDLPLILRRRSLPPRSDISEFLIYYIFFKNWFIYCFYLSDKFFLIYLTMFMNK